MGGARATSGAAPVGHALHRLRAAGLRPGRASRPALAASHARPQPGAAGPDPPDAGRAAARGPVRLRRRPAHEQRPDRPGRPAAWRAHRAESAGRAPATGREFGRAVGVRDRPGRPGQAGVGGVAGSAAPAPEVAWAWRRLLAEGGRSAVSALAAEVRWSRRHFTDRFRSEVELAPKQAARVLRFERACDSLRSRPRQELAELALACGYYDQPHLNNEWRAIAGCSPRAWIVEELPFLQYDDEHARAFSTV